MGVIYVRPNLINGKKYVGQATDLKKRQSDWNCLTQPYAGKAINNARAKYGLDAFDFEILKECDDKELDFWEKYYIKELNTKVPYGYNLTEGGDGCKGYHHTEEIKKIIGNGVKKSYTEERKQYLREIQKGKRYSEETKRKISEARKGEKNHNFGKHLSEETKKKISESMTNGKCSKHLLQIDKETNEVISEFPSVSEVERQFGFIHSNISSCCLGKRKTAYGFIWRYK